MANNKTSTTMTTTIQMPFVPRVAYHPGFTLAEKLEELGMSVKEFAVRTSKPEKTINAILKGNSSITSDMAVAFESVTGIPAHFWMQKQQNYNEYVARQKREEVLASSEEWARQFPVREMQRRGWLPATKTRQENVVALFSYFAVSSPAGWEDYYCNQQLKVAFRISLSQTKHPYAISAWLRRGELQAAATKVLNDYSSEALKLQIPQMKALVPDLSYDMPVKLQHLCAECGIKLLYTECLPKAPISGATRWIQNVPCIQLSGRYKSQDRFWFTFFHEIGHILLHGKKDIFLEDIEDFEQQKEKEAEADRFASDTLLDARQEREVIENGDFSRTTILFYSQKFQTAPSIIIGRLQHLSRLPYQAHHDLKPNIELNFN